MPPRNPTVLHTNPEFARGGGGKHTVITLSVPINTRMALEQAALEAGYTLSRYCASALCIQHDLPVPEYQRVRDPDNPRAHGIKVKRVPMEGKMPAPRKAGRVIGNDAFAGALEAKAKARKADEGAAKEAVTPAIAAPALPPAAGPEELLGMVNLTDLLD